jgi:uncharacterized membrane protein (UPF0127 family)
MRKILSVGASVVAVALSVLMLVQYSVGNLKDGQTVRISVNRSIVVATAATKEASRSRGLSGTVALPPGRGMLFNFEHPELLSFWMKDMRYPIDIIWINRETVVGVTPNIPAPAPGTPDSALPSYVAPAPANRALEVPAGWAASHGVQAGDTIRIPA